MTPTIENAQNFQLAQLTQRAGGKVTSAIAGASQETGVDFAYLMQQASAESSFKTDAKAKTSSATGLFQFIDRTWLDMIENHGHKYGIDKSMPKQDLLSLRNDPEISSFMTAELAAENTRYLKNTLGADFKVGATEMYFAHFMGAGKAAAFLETVNEAPQKRAADLFPAEAKANRGVFYTPSGRARNVGEVYAFFDKKFGIEGTAEQALALAQNDAQAPKIMPDYNGVRIQDHIDSLARQEVVAENKVKARAEAAQYTDLQTDTLMRLASHQPYMDLLSGSNGSTGKSYGASSFDMPIIRQSNRLPSANFGNLLQNPTELLFLAQLDDSLEKPNA